ncbi:preprotein translocase subunit SecE [Urbifossiella limnaea]|uniref:Protein translocase subunit SecE n=1 Tax=Urbifossiella limnaea TaxID=2528023 RepID=A0A517XS48_9BACT|nr:preprotein translocase subunit SecE [Urbifossiella limnaea]QDU20313.1 preprotein translocase subunit SecE [Urbifossiella limnaea]
MATAVEPSPPTQPRTPSADSGLLLYSLVGAGYVLAALAVVFYAIPTLWAEYVRPAVGGDTILEAFVRGVLTLGALGGLVWFGLKLAGTAPPKGMRGGVFLVLVTFFLVLLLGGWATAKFEGAAGTVVTAIVVGGILFGAFRLLVSPRGTNWMLSLEEQGWFHGGTFKRVLGRVVRRVTMIGILGIGLTGAYALVSQGTLPDNWDVPLPFLHTEDGAPKLFRLLSDAKITIPLLICVLTAWVAYRAVNMPAFAEFLIATEAEMNKVSWSSRKRLAADTVVVLVCTIFMALFLLFVDLFWGWLLSSGPVGVLPSRSETGQKGGQVQAARW